MQGGHMIENPGPRDHPLRPWDAGDEDTAINAQHLVHSMHAVSTLARLHRGEPLDDHDIALLGIVNFQAYLMTYEPVAALMPDRVLLHPALAGLVPEIAAVPGIAAEPERD